MPPQSWSHSTDLQSCLESQTQESRAGGMTAVGLRAQPPWKCSKDTAAEVGVTYVSREAGDSDTYGYLGERTSGGEDGEFIHSAQDPCGRTVHSTGGAETRKRKAPKGWGEQQCPWLSGEACGPSVTWGCLGFIWAWPRGCRWAKPCLLGFQVSACSCRSGSDPEGGQRLATEGDGVAHSTWVALRGHASSAAGLQG